MFASIFMPGRLKKAMRRYWWLAVQECALFAVEQHCESLARSRKGDGVEIDVATTGCTIRQSRKALEQELTKFQNKLAGESKATQQRCERYLHSIELTPDLLGEGIGHAIAAFLGLDWICQALFSSYIFSCFADRWVEVLDVAEDEAETMKRAITVYALATNLAFMSPQQLNAYARDKWGNLSGPSSALV